VAPGLDGNDAGRDLGSVAAPLCDSQGHPLPPGLCTLPGDAKQAGNSLRVTPLAVVAAFRPRFNVRTVALMPKRRRPENNFPEPASMRA